MGTVAFLCAMPSELKPVVGKLSLRPTTIAGITKAYRGSLAGREIVAIHTGMGTAMARDATTHLLDAVEVDHALMVGITGGVENDTPIGTLVLPETVLNGNTGARYTPAVVGGAKRSGTMWTTDVMTPPDQLQQMRADGVVCLDMETAAVAEVCEARNVAWSVWRVISDRPDDEIDDDVFKLSNQDGSPNLANVARYVATHPGRVPALARMGRNMKIATERAADAAIAACAHLPLA